MITFQHPPIGALSTSPAVFATSIVERMADKMLEMGMNGTAVTADSLFEHSDFTRADIDAHGREASDLARHRAIRQVA
ncbi:MAG: hypothetical protein E5V35_34140 [Mesorhizobium sp.]|nr:MAG: hypothetical protein E5V35_34140 [Mesorhizobium sp.]